MENFAPLVFNGLGWGIIHSLWMGAVLYGVLMLAFQFSNWRAKTKSLLLAVALSMLLAFFFLTFLYQVVYRQASGLAAATGGDMVFFSLLDYSGSVSLKATIEHYFPTVIAFYVLGVLFQSVLVINGFRKLHLIRRQGLLEVPESWKALLVSKKLQMGLRMPIALHLSTLVDVPAVIGHLKPIILFPMALFSGISMEQVEAVLIHELAHIKRSDYLINLLKTITETLLFFNPFVWLIGRMLEVEREHACDDVVVALTSSPISYARTLLWLEERQQAPTSSLAMQAINKKKQLLHRIQRMTNMKNNYLNAKHKLAILTLLLGCIVSLAWVKPFAGDEKKPTETYSSLSDTIDVKVDFPGDSAKVLRLHAVASDTLLTTEKTGITFIGKDGSTQTFERYEDLPDSLKVKVDAVRLGVDSLRIVYNGSEWNKKTERRKLVLKEEQDKMIVQLRKHIDSLSSYFDSEEWKEGFAAVDLNIEQIRKQADSLKARFDTTEWKDKFAAYRDSYHTYFNSPEGKRARELLEQQLEANKAKIAEWRDMAIQRDKIMQRHGDSIRAYLESPEWKSKLEQLKRELKKVDTTAM